MGGNALKNTFTRRYQREEYIQLSSDILGIFDQHNIKAHIVPAYKNKQEFGDMDLVVASEEFNDIPDINKFIEEAFHPNQIYLNHSNDYTTNVWSFDVKEFQIDMILHPEHMVNMALSYYSYNDVSNLMGRVAHKLGLKLGHDGLKYVLKDGDYVIGEIILSQDMARIQHFLQFNYQEWCSGMYELEDIFKFIIECPFYNYEIFDLANRNAVSRERDRKRKTYSEFLKYAEANPKENPYIWSKDKTVYIPFFLNEFDKWDEYRELIEKEQRRKLLKSKFNGTIVSKYTGLVDKELGLFMKFLKTVINEERILAEDEESLRSLICAYNGSGVYMKFLREQ